MTLKLSDMKKLKCANPHCNHKNHEIVLRQACHNAPTLNFVDGDEMQIICAVCQRYVVSFNVKNVKQFKPKMCETYETFTTFMSDGSVEVKCAKCNELIATADVV